MTQENKLMENYILIKPSELRTMRLPYDARAELDRVERSLEYSLIAKPMFNFKTSTPEEEAARLDAWHNARIAEINGMEQQYRERLAEAKKSGAVDTGEANRLLVDLETSFSKNPFEQARRETIELYIKERNQKMDSSLIGKPFTYEYKEK